MYRITKVLNHNTVLAVGEDGQSSWLILGKGVGFGKKVTERIELRETDTLYSLQESTERGRATELVKSISPECLEIADEILGRAEQTFGKIDRNILFPMADHLEYAIQRIRKQEQISNPLNDDIRVLFHAEYKVAQEIAPILLERMNIQIEADEIGYIALHIHSAIEDQRVSQAMQMAGAVRDCISLVEREIGRPIDLLSLSYNRLMNHVRYMVARALSGGKLKINMNDYIETKFPKAFQTATTVCDHISCSLKCPLDEMEIGYLAMHIERVASDELKEEEK